MFAKRSSEPEIIDSDPPTYTPEEYADCLKKLHQIGTWLGGNSASFQALDALSPPPESILDVGCGGGLFTILMAKRFPHARVVGIEVNPLAISLAELMLANMPNPPMNVSFILKNQPELNEKSQSFDVVISTLVCHHLSDQALKNYLKKACLIARRKVIINDLHRHPLAYLAFKCIAPLFFRNRLIEHDGLLSIKRAFTFADWRRYLNAAGIKANQAVIQWHFAFRWLVQIDCRSERS